MQFALMIAERSTCPRGHNGAVLTRSNRIISIGYNGSPPGAPHCDSVGCRHESDNSEGCVRTLHAESNAILWAAREGIHTTGSTLYTTMSPCLSCAKIILTAGVKNVFYNTAYRNIAGIVYLRQNNVIISIL